MTVVVLFDHHTLAVSQLMLALEALSQMVADRYVCTGSAIAYNRTVEHKRSPFDVPLYYVSIYIVIL